MDNIVHKSSDTRTIVSVVVDKALYSFDLEFDYYLPEGTSAVVG